MRAGLVTFAVPSRSSRTVAASACDGSPRYGRPPGQKVQCVDQRRVLGVETVVAFLDGTHEEPVGGRQVAVAVQHELYGRGLRSDVPNGGSARRVSPSRADALLSAPVASVPT